MLCKELGGISTNTMIVMISGPEFRHLMCFCTLGPLKWLQDPRGLREELGRTIYTTTRITPEAYIRVMGPMQSEQNTVRGIHRIAILVSSIR